MDPVAALEIGTTKVIAMVGEMREDGTVMITGVGEHKSAGVRKGEVIDLENAVACARVALDEAEKISKIALVDVHLCVSGGHIRGTIGSGSVPIVSSDGVVSDDDVDEVSDIARAVSLADDRQIIHTMRQHFCIDDQGRLHKPEGMSGSKLSLDMLVLHGLRSQLQNSSRVVESMQIEVHDTVFSGLCSALSVLTAEQKKSGVVVIDLGGGTTDYVAYADGIVACGGSLGVGGDHITNDVASAFNIPVARAEKLKKDIGSATVLPVVEPDRMSLSAEVGFPERTINIGSMHVVIHARMNETLSMVKKRLDDENVLSMVGAGIILTGGGAHLKGITELAETVFGVPCFIGKPRGVAGITMAMDGPEYAACCGLVQYGFRVQADSQSGGSVFGSLVRTLFGSR